MQGCPGVIHLHTAVQAGAAVQGDGAYMLLVEVLVDLELVGLMVDLRTEGPAQRRQRVAGDHHNRPMDLRNHADRCPVDIFPGRVIEHPEQYTSKRPHSA